jgi:HK97 gp10 family phage protein
MAKTVIKIEGVENVVAELKKRGMNVSRGLEAICTAGALVIESEAKGNVGGTIGEEMMHETTARTKTKVEVAVGPSKKAWFGKFVEFGTASHRVLPVESKALKFQGRYAARVAHPGGAARPFLRPALDTKKPQAEAAMGRKAESIIE